MTTHTIIEGDVLDGLRSLPDNSVQCCVTSPPYWALRDYGCDGQIGLEKTPEEYVAKMVEVFREVRRVLRDDGTLWLNLGDSYAGSPVGSFNGGSEILNGRDLSGHEMSGGIDKLKASGLKPKDMIGIPWRVAFALQADGWVLRSDIVWAKRNCMPESVRDRPTKAHEMIFLFAKAKWVGEPRGRFSFISNEDARWIALFLETEGNIAIKRTIDKEGKLNYGCQLAFANSSKALLERLTAITGHGTILERKGKNWPVYYWQVSNKVGRDLLYRIYPYLIFKHRQARIAIYQESLLYHRGGLKPERKRRTDEEVALLERLWIDLKLCNKFGNPDLTYVPEPEYGHWDSQPYFYDGDAIREPAADPEVCQNRDGFRGGNGRLYTNNNTFDNSFKVVKPNKQDQTGNPTYTGFNDRWTQKMARNGTNIKGHSGNLNGNGEPMCDGITRNKRTVWWINPQPRPEAHFATFPDELAETCIKAGTSEYGCCPKCGAPWERVVERVSSHGERPKINKDRGDAGTGGFNTIIKDLGWQPTCTCGKDELGSCVVLDPFMGSGTVAVIARDLNRSSIGIELNPEYVKIIKERLQAHSQLDTGVIQYRFEKVPV